MATVVSCYYRIASKHSYNAYDAWIRNFMSIPMNTVLFVDEDSHSYLSSLYPETQTRKYVIRPFEAFTTSKLSWESDENIDHERRDGHNRKLYMVWNEKPFFMLEALKMNPYCSEYYMWVDMGCFRSEGMKFPGFPSVSKANHSKIQFLNIEPFSTSEYVNPFMIDERFRYVNRIGGTMFMCPKLLIETFADVHLGLLRDFQTKGLFKGKDQSLYAFAVLQNPDMFELIVPSSNTGYDKWFYFHEHFSHSLNFVIVGPGIMPIPPTGWGAVEILIWDYAKNLEELGHTVRILNDKNLTNVENDIKRIRPDVVHIQYDDYAHLSEKIRDHVKLVGITTHFGYLEQHEKWGGYINVFYNMLRQTYKNVYHFVLSDGIGDVYKRHGVPAGHILLTPNGANSDLFQYSKTPQYTDRSIYLAKLDYRKRQYMFQDMPNLYFAGNPADHRFNVNSPRYLGEWSKEYLYNNLTHYGNLVLLSDGEADPLVVKEALQCGLGVVISQWSTANLDLSKPYITVIPEDKIGDLAYVESEIEKNRVYSVQNRDAIREYGLTFTWTRLVKEYVDNIYQLL